MRNKPLALATAIALSAALLGASASDLDDGTQPPAGITPVHATLAFVIGLNRKAVGKRTAGLGPTRTENWTLSADGLTGTERFVQAGKDERDDETAGPFHTASGTLAGKSWHQNANGEVVIEHDIHHLDSVSARAIATEDPSALTLIGTVAAPVDAYVIKVAPRGGRLLYLYVDKASGQIVRRDSSIRGRRHITTYGDFRTTDGLTEPWHVHFTDGRPENDRDETLTALTIGLPVDPSALAVPKATTPVALASPRVSIPIKLMNDRVIIPVKIGGHTVDFQMDSGASVILINNAVVHALKLPTYGSSLGDTAGTYPEGRTIVPLLTFGGVAMTNVEMDRAPFTWWTDEKTPVAGLMGFDFIDGAVVHIDYQNGTLEAYDPATFVPPAGATALPIALDDDVPMIDVGIAKAIGHLFILDTGADRSALFTSFVTDHPNDVVDLGLGDRELEQYPFVTDFQGVGGLVKYRPLQVGPFDFAGYVFPKWMFTGTHGAPSFEGDDFDGLVGQDVLRNFDVYLDYAHEKIWLVPNARYKSRWG